MPEEKPRPNQKLRYERIRRGWSQQELADEIGTTPLNVGRWERGVTQPGPHFQQKLCAVFEKSAQELGLLQEDTHADTATSVPPQTAAIALSQDSPVSLWNVPYNRNLLFTGREDILTQLHNAFMQGQHPIALAQPQAISGLGGIGKTQTAVEYAYRYRDSYESILWARADSTDLLISDFLLIAALLNLPQRNEQDQSIVIKAVVHWFDTHERWLLILDNADQLELVNEFIPSAGKGHVLLTTRANSTGTMAQRIELDTMGLDEGMLFLLRRAKLLKGNTSSLQSVSNTIRGQAQAIVEAVDGLPLALDQAGAYIEETGCNLSDYLKFYKARRSRLLRTRGHIASGHPEPVATTWSLSFEKVERTNPVAAELLRLCAFLHPDEIPEAMILEGATELGPILQIVGEDEMELNEAMGELRKYSLVKRDPEKKFLNIHRLVQVVVKDGIEQEIGEVWVRRVVNMMSKVLSLQPSPFENVTTWSVYQQYLPHIQICAQYIEQYHIILPESAQLLHQTAVYLYERGLYLEVEPFLHSALKQREHLFGADNLDVADTLNRLARLYYHQCKFAEAEALYQRTLAIREKYLGAEHADIAETLNYLGELYNVQGKNTESEPVYRRAIEMRTHLFGPEHPLVAQCLNNLSWLYVDQGRYTEAEPLTQRALSICERAYGTVHLDIAYSLNCMSWLYFCQKKYKLAEPLLARALKIYQEIYGTEHPSIATGLVNLARVYQELGWYGETETMYLAALNVQERLQGRVHPDVAQILHNIALLYQSQGQYAQAEPFYLEAIDIGRKTMGSNHAYVARYISNLGSLYTALDRYEEAQTLLEQAIALRETILGSGHPDLTTTLDQYAVLLDKMNRETEALKIKARAQTIRAKQEEAPAQ